MYIYKCFVFDPHAILTSAMWLKLTPALGHKNIYNYIDKHCLHTYIYTNISISTYIFTSIFSLSYIH